MNIIIKLIGINIEGISKMTKQKEKENHFMIMEIHMKGIIKIGIKKGKECINIITEICMKVNLKKI